MRVTLLVLLLLVVYGYWHVTGRGGSPVETRITAAYPLAAPAVQLAEPPVQHALNPSRDAFPTRDDYRIVPLAEFHAEARVLAALVYRVGREADLSPIDLALGWGPMAEDRVVAALEISQSGRWYRWRAAPLPIPRRDIELHSANMHMIPANAAVSAALAGVQPGQVVTLRGYLVEAQGRDGWKWRSSLSREDTGQRGCELVLVESLAVR